MKACPNCGEIAPRYVSAPIRGASFVIVPVEHCGCYYDQPGEHGGRTYEVDADLLEQVDASRPCEPAFASCSGEVDDDERAPARLGCRSRVHPGGHAELGDPFASTAPWLTRGMMPAEVPSDDDERR